VLDTCRPLPMRNRLALTLIVAALVAAVPGSAGASSGPAPATVSPSSEDALVGSLQAGDSKTFRFYGSGWGHGVGLSQYGAYGLARRDWSHVRILDHFYRGTTVGAVPGAAPEVLRVGLTWDHRTIHLLAQGGPVYLRSGSPTAENRFKIPNGYQWSVRATRRGRYRILNGKGKLIDVVGGPNRNLYAAYRGAGSRLRIPEAGHGYARGYVEFNAYRPACSGSCSPWVLRAIAVVTPQDYVYGVAEVPSSWPMEAMEAQAVAARSYGLAVASHGQHRSDHGACNCGLYPSTWDQVYAGYDKETQGAGWVDAVKATRSQVVLYRGTVAMAVYSSSSGGYSESNEYSWFNAPIPYLRSVCDPGDYTEANPNRTWSARFTGRVIGSRLWGYGYHVGTVTGFRSARRTTAGRIIAVTVTGTGGSDGKSVRIAGPTLARMLGLRTDKVWINVNRNVTGPFRAKYDSLMCRPGLAQSARRAVPGGVIQRFANGAIYVSSDTKRPVWSHGAVYEKYVAWKGPRGPLGFPVSDVSTLAGSAGCAARECWREKFTSGRIYLKRSLGAHELHGTVLQYYLGQGGVNGPLGFPISDVSVSSGTATARFEHGRVTCTSSGCSEAPN
jgi:SpoIID/LytB domain protein